MTKKSHSPNDRDTACLSGLRRGLYVLLAAVFFLLGMIGVVLPGLPTTPFLLLTAYFLMRSWPRMHRLLLANRLFGPMLRDWHHHRAVTWRVKVQATAMVAAMIALVIVWSSYSLPVSIAVISLAAVGLTVIHSLPTHRPASDSTDLRLEPGAVSQLRNDRGETLSDLPHRVDAKLTNEARRSHAAAVRDCPSPQ